MYRCESTSGTKWVVLLLLLSGMHSHSVVSSTALAGSCAHSVMVALLNNTGCLCANDSRVQAAVESALQGEETCFQYNQNKQLPPSHEPRSSRKLTTAEVLGILLPIALLSCCFTVVGLLLYKWSGQRRSRTRTFRRINFLGMQKHPQAGTDTTLVVTDIQGSTALWEMLPDKVMDAALKTHHSCMRKLLHTHHGYESATEGDSFILAFHNAFRAVEFCLDAQLKLLCADWPPDLLEVESCKPMYLRSLEDASRPSAADFQDQPLSNHTTNHMIQTSQESDASLNRDGWNWYSTMFVEKFMHRRNAGNETRSPSRLQEIKVPLCCSASFTQDGKGCYTFQQACQNTWVEVSVHDPAATLVFRGLRVRMGVHSGVESLLAAGGRILYAGKALEMAKAVADISHGGMIILSEAAYQLLPMEEMWERMVVLQCGEHELKPELKQQVQLYQVLDRSLRGRTARLSPICTSAQLCMGVNSAPLGQVTVVFLYLVGSHTLISWNSAVFEESYGMFCEAAKLELKDSSGYLVELDRGLLLASFNSPKNAILWCLDLQTRMLDLDWPEALLSHELCEEMLYPSPLGQRIMFRGLRIKAGIDCGGVRSSVHAITGRITYRGKVMNRAARIASTATSGQVLCPADVWLHAHEAASNELRRVEGTSLGLFRLKGIPERMELLQCRYRSAKGRSVRMSGVIFANVEEYVDPSELRQSNSSVLDNLRLQYSSSSTLEPVNTSPTVQAAAASGSPLQRIPSLRYIRRSAASNKALLKRSNSLSLAYQHSCETLLSNISNIAPEVFNDIENSQTHRQSSIDLHSLEASGNTQDARMNNGPTASLDITYASLQQIAIQETSGNSELSGPEVDKSMASFDLEACIDDTFSSAMTDSRIVQEAAEQPAGQSWNLSVPVDDQCQVSLGLCSICSSHEEDNVTHSLREVR